MEIGSQILEFIEQAGCPVKLGEITEYLNIGKSHVANALDALIDTGCVRRTKKNTYALGEKRLVIKGCVIGNPRGFAFCVREDGGDDIFLPPNRLRGALHGDTVLVRLARGQTGHSTEGEVVSVLERANETVVGTYRKFGKDGMVIADDVKISKRIFVEKKNAKGAKSGQKVVVEIIQWGDRPRGRIKQVLGYEDEKGVGIMSILYARGIELKFPERARREAEEIPQTVSEKAAEKREDWRDRRVFTIDGADAKDLDDAVSIEETENGFVLGVHIADVSHYVKKGTALDEAALSRGTSVYPVDRVVPMLPEELSNGICSLHPDVDRLTLSCIMEVDRSGDVTGYRIAKTVIRSVERMTYDDVWKIIRGDKELLARYANIAGDIEVMRKLCLILQRRRHKRGSLDFDLPEPKIVLDENGRAVSVELRERNLAHMIIEEFMLLANETVARHMANNNIPCIYRVHENPDAEKMREFVEFAANLGYTVKNADNVTPLALQHILTASKGKPEEGIISNVMLRSMRKARYSSACLGHFGLAAKYYLHFTSPIRRYPDLMVHRMLKWSLAGRNKELKEMEPKMEAIAIQCSQREIAAMEAERDVIDYKKAEYMESHLGEEFEGVISGVTPNGFFVQLKNTVEGFVRISDMPGTYAYDEKRYALVDRAGHEFALGQKAIVRVIGADAQTRRVDFEFVTKIE